MEKRPWRILPTIVFSQFAGTATWFASNAILGDLQAAFHLQSNALGYMTSAVQLGFISGTLLFAFLVISDRFSPRKVFFICSILNAACNFGIFAFAEGFWSLLAIRFLTGFFLAGIYPVGMKIAAGWYQKGLGKALGFLVGALVLGTAFPHVLNALGHGWFSWEIVIISISILAFLGGLAMFLLVPDGPYLSKGTKFDRRALLIIFQSRELRAAAFGYFGHMWELYTVWAFMPVFISAFAQENGLDLNISMWSFLIIAAGFLGCTIGGMISLRYGSAIVAFIQLSGSGIICLLSPLLFQAPAGIFLTVLLLWGILVVGDSPQFSALTAMTAAPQFVGSALTIVNCIGFAITIASIQLVNYLSSTIALRDIFLPLIIGPVFGLIALKPLFSRGYTPGAK